MLLLISVPRLHRAWCRWLLDVKQPEVRVGDTGMGQYFPRPGFLDGHGHVILPSIMSCAEISPQAHHSGTQTDRISAVIYRTIQFRASYLLPDGPSFNLRLTRQRVILSVLWGSIQMNSRGITIPGTNEAFALYNHCLFLSRSLLGIMLFHVGGTLKLPVLPRLRNCYPFPFLLPTRPLDRF
jgi:hypothetical protein